MKKVNRNGIEVTFYPEGAELVAELRDLGRVHPDNTVLANARVSGDIDELNAATLLVAVTQLEKEIEHAPAATMGAYWRELDRFHGLAQWKDELLFLTHGINAQKRLLGANEFEMRDAISGRVGKAEAFLTAKIGRLANTARLEVSFHPELQMTLEESKPAGLLEQVAGYLEENGFGDISVDNLSWAEVRKGPGGTFVIQVDDAGAHVLAANFGVDILTPEESLLADMVEDDAARPAIGM